MLPLLAQSAPDAAALKSFLEVFFYLAGSGTALLVGWKNLRTKAATETALREVHGRISRERKELDLAIAKIEAAQAQAALRMDAELRAIRDMIDESKEAAEARVEKLRGAMDDQTKLIISVIRERRA